MKKCVAVIISAVLLLALLLPLAASAEITMVEVTKGASIRNKPGYDGDKLTLAQPGSQYLYLGTEGNWYKIQMTSEKTGYLPKDSCRLTSAPGIPTKSAKDAFATIVKSMQQKGSFKADIPDSFYGKTAIAVYYDLGGSAEELSPDEYAKEGSYWSVPEELLATKMDEADWALVIYPTFTDEEGNRIQMNVFAADMKNTEFYGPYNMDDQVTVLENDQCVFELDSTIRGMKEFIIYPRWEKAFRLENDEDYQDGLRYMKEQKYYSAYVSFNMSSLEEAAEMAEKCRQPWPKNGELWHNSAVKGTGMQLTINVNQNEERAMMFKLYKDGVHAATLFVRGNGKATVKLPGGTYKIRQGVGWDWYGLNESFGPEGSYATMTFGENDDTTVKLQSGYSYQITVNTSDYVAPEDRVGTTYDDWGDF